MRKAVKPYGLKYYDYILVYVDDVLMITNQTIKSMYRLNADDVGAPKTSLMAQMKPSHI
jgi:hypothetical protein